MVGNYREVFRESMTAAYCAFMGVGANQYRFLASLVGQTGDVPQQVVDRTLGLLDDTVRALCGRSVPPPPIVGGECPIGYGINITFTANHLNPAQTYTATRSSDCNFAPFIYGPVSAPWLETDANGFLSWQIRGFTSAGAQQQVTITDSVSSLFYRDVTIESLEFFPCDQNAPPCEPRYRLPRGFNFDLDVGDVSFTYDSGGGNLIVVNGRLFIEPPVINIDGRLSIPFTFRIGPNSLNISPTFRGDLNVNFGDGGIDPPPPPIGQPGGDIDVDVSVDVNGNPPPPVPPPSDVEFWRPVEGRLLYGVLVNSIISPDASLSVLFQSENPDIYVPSLGHVAFFQGLGENAAWSEDIRVKSRSQLILAPDPLRAISAAGTPQPGVSFQLNPVYIDAAAYLGLQSP